MVGYGENGSVVGPQNLTSNAVANGVWTLGEMAEAQRNGTWPNPDSITAFGWMTLPSGAPAPSRFVTELDGAGNPVILAGTDSSHNYVLELDKTTHAFTYMRDYTTNDGNNFRAYQLGITPSGYTSANNKTDVMFLGGVCYNRNAGSYQTANWARVLKSGSTGWDTFNPYGSSSTGYFSWTMASGAYDNFMSTGRITFKAASTSPATTESWWFPNGGSWRNQGSNPQRARFQIYKDSYSVAPDVRGVGHLYGNNYNCIALGQAGMVGTSSPVMLSSAEYWNQVILNSVSTLPTGSQTDLFNYISSQRMPDFHKTGTYMGNESGAGSNRVTNGNNNLAIGGKTITNSKPLIARVDTNGTGIWAKTFTPTTYATDVEAAKTGAIVSSDGTKVYCSWSSNNGSATNRGYVIVGCWNWADGTLLWKNRLTWTDPNDTSDTRFYDHSMKEMSQDSTGDSLLFSARVYQNTAPNFISSFPVLKLRSDGLGLGTYSFPGQTGAAGGTISMTYAADTSPETSFTMQASVAYSHHMNFGVGINSSHSSANAAVTRGYTWGVA